MKYLIVFVLGVALGLGAAKYVVPPTAGECVDSISNSVQNSISSAYNRITGK